MYQVQPKDTPAPVQPPAQAPATKPSASTSDKPAPIGSHDNPRPGQIFNDWAAF